MIYSHLLNRAYQLSVKHNLNDVLNDIDSLSMLELLGLINYLSRIDS